MCAHPSGKDVAQVSDAVDRYLSAHTKPSDHSAAQS